jgi:hypothetical protein
MNEQFIEPSLDEGFDYIFRYNSKEDKIMYKGVDPIETIATPVRR